jgi:hypothetical protein
LLQLLLHNVIDLCPSLGAVNALKEEQIVIGKSMTHRSRRRQPDCFRKSLRRRGATDAPAVFSTGVLATLRFLSDQKNENLTWFLNRAGTYVHIQYSARKREKDTFEIHVSDPSLFSELLCVRRHFAVHSAERVERFIFGCAHPRDPGSISQFALVDTKKIKCSFHLEVYVSPARRR